jgi:hypothetical protein
MYFGIKKKFEPVKTAKLNFIMPENIFLPAYLPPDAQKDERWLEVTPLKR